jgi:hypothetical protein
MSASTELSASLIEQINTAHREVCASANSARDALIAQVNKARQAGIYLDALREQTPHGQWEQMFSSKSRTGSVFAFSVDTALLYIKISERIKQPITELAEGMRSLKDVMVAVGALNAPAGHGDQKPGALTPLSFLITETGRMRSQWGKLGGDDYLKSLSPKGREDIANQIQPMHELINRIWNTVTQ